MPTNERRFRAINRQQQTMGAAAQASQTPRRFVTQPSNYIQQNAAAAGINRDLRSNYQQVQDQRAKLAQAAEDAQWRRRQDLIQNALGIGNAGLRQGELRQRQQEFDWDRDMQARRFALESREAARDQFNKNRMFGFDREKHMDDTQRQTLQAFLQYGKDYDPRSFGNLAPRLMEDYNMDFTGLRRMPTDTELREFTPESIREAYQVDDEGRLAYNVGALRRQPPMMNPADVARYAEPSSVLESYDPTTGQLNVGGLRPKQEGGYSEMDQLRIINTYGDLSRAMTAAETDEEREAYRQQIEAFYNRVGEQVGLPRPPWLPPDWFAEQAPEDYTEDEIRAAWEYYSRGQ